MSVQNLNTMSGANVATSTHQYIFYDEAPLTLLNVQTLTRKTMASLFDYSKWDTIGDEDTTDDEEALMGGRKSSTSSGGLGLWKYGDSKSPVDPVRQAHAKARSEASVDGSSVSSEGPGSKNAIERALDVVHDQSCALRRPSLLIRASAVVLRLVR